MFTTFSGKTCVGSSKKKWGKENADELGTGKSHKGWERKLYVTMENVTIVWIVYKWYKEEKKHIEEKIERVKGKWKESIHTKRALKKNAMLRRRDVNIMFLVNEEGIKAWKNKNKKVRGEKLLQVMQ